MSGLKKTRLFLVLLLVCAIVTNVSLADPRLIHVSAGKAPDEFTQLFDVETSAAGADPIQFTIILKNFSSWEGLVVRGSKQVKEVRGLIQIARVEIIRHDPYRTAVEFPLVFTGDGKESRNTTFRIEHDLLRHATAEIVVDGFGILPVTNKSGSSEPVMFQIDLESFVKPRRS